MAKRFRAKVSTGFEPETLLLAEGPIAILNGCEIDEVFVKTNFPVTPRTLND
jgi:hypothetical protein